MILQCIDHEDTYLILYVNTITRIRIKAISIHLEIRAKVNFMEDLQRAIHKRAVKY